MNIGGATEFYKELAEQTGGAYVRFTNFSIISDMFMAGTNITLELPLQFILFNKKLTCLRDLRFHFNFLHGHLSFERLVNFVTVCYREVDDKHLQDFQEELEAGGNMTEEVKNVIQQIQEAPRQPTNQPTQVSFTSERFF